MLLRPLIFGAALTLTVIGQSSPAQAECYHDLSHAAAYMPQFEYHGESDYAVNMRQAYEQVTHQMQLTLDTPISGIIDAAGGPNAAIAAVRTQMQAFEKFAADTGAVAEDWKKNQGASVAQFQYVAAAFGEYAKLVMQEYENAIRCHQDAAIENTTPSDGGSSLLDQLHDPSNAAGGGNQGGFEEATAEQRRIQRQFDQQAAINAQRSAIWWENYQASLRRQEQQSQQNFNTFLNILGGLANTYGQIKAYKNQQKRVNRSNSGSSSGSRQTTTIRSGGSNDCVSIPGQKTCGVE